MSDPITARDEIDAESPIHPANITAACPELSHITRLQSEIIAAVEKRGGRWTDPLREQFDDLQFRWEFGARLLRKWRTPDLSQPSTEFLRRVSATLYLSYKTIDVASTSDHDDENDIANLVAELIDRMEDLEREVRTVLRCGEWCGIADEIETLAGETQTYLREAEAGLCDGREALRKVNERCAPRMIQIFNRMPIEYRKQKSISQLEPVEAKDDTEETVGHLGLMVDHQSRTIRRRGALYDGITVDLSGKERLWEAFLILLAAGDNVASIDVWKRSYRGEFGDARRQLIQQLRSELSLLDVDIPPRHWKLSEKSQNSR